MATRLPEHLYAPGHYRRGLRASVAVRSLPSLAIGHSPTISLPAVASINASAKRITPTEAGAVVYPNQDAQLLPSPR